MQSVPTPLLLAGVAAMLFASCSVEVDGGACGEDSDCATGLVCLFDLDRDTTYCTAPCVNDAECPSHQACRQGVRDLTSPAVADATRFCVDLVRACSERELCNGLDDDCDGVVDGASCELITSCLDDAVCGAYTCGAPPNQPTTVCQPPNETGAIIPDFQRCSSGDQCVNGACITGFCSPLCRPAEDCPQIRIQDRTLNFVCAEAVGATNVPRHNQCQAECATHGACADGQSCVWRQIFQAEPSHLFVCSLLDPARKPLGEACTNNEPSEGDAECQHGLCFGRVCTEVCGGPGGDCSAVGPDYQCLTRTLRYGDREFGAFICVRP